MNTRVKLSKWDGNNKAKVRALKIQSVKEAKKDGHLGNDEVAVTLAGSKAHFEISMANRRLVKPENIITIQSPIHPDLKTGSKTAKALVKLRDVELPGMRIWPSSFESFTEGYTKEGTRIPSFKAGSAPAWYKSRILRKEMHDFIDAPAKKVCVADVDLCGIFSETSGTSTTRLMYNGVLGDAGVLFINHQKGRDGKCVPYLNEYFHHEGLFDLGSLQDYFGEALTLTTDNKDKYSKEAMFYAIRYTLVPIYYIVEAFKAGYQLEPTRLVEYRDRNSDSGIGVNMLQWFFKFEKLESAKLAEGTSFATLGRDLKSLRQKEMEILRYQLQVLTDEAYVYHDYVD
jgi:hypothetical protein